MKNLLAFGFMIFSFLASPLAKADGDGALLIFQCSLGEYMPVRAVEVYKWAGRLHLLELSEAGWESWILPEKQWIDKKLELHPDNGTTGLVYKDGEQWSFQFSFENGYSRGTIDCFSR